jgi:hypothetical protein
MVHDMYWAVQSTAWRAVLLVGVQRPRRCMLSRSDFFSKKRKPCTPNSCGTVWHVFPFLENVYIKVTRYRSQNFRALFTHKITMCSRYFHRYFLLCRFSCTVLAISAIGGMKPQPSNRMVQDLSLKAGSYEVAQRTSMKPNVRYRVQKDYHCASLILSAPLHPVSPGSIFMYSYLCSDLRKSLPFKV